MNTVTEYVTEQYNVLHVTNSVDVLICLFVSVFTFTISTFHMLSPSASSGAVLSVIGSVYVDLVALLFLLKGFSFSLFINNVHEKEYHIQILKTTIPDLTISTIPWIFILALTTPKEVGYWVNLALTPTCLSPFVDYRANNDFRGINEGTWILQTQLFLVLLGEHVYRQCLITSKKITIRGYQATLFVTWLLGFTHLYVALKHPKFIPAVLRSPLTNLTFFSQGIFIYLSGKNGQLKDGITEIQRLLTSSTMVLVSVISVISFLYLHHADFTTEYNHCHHTVGGTPCLWVFDACNLRYLPLLVVLFFWGVSSSHSILGEDKPMFLQIFDNAFESISKFHKYCPVFLLYSQTFSLLIHYPLTKLFPAIPEAIGVPLLVTEIILVCFLCIQWRNLVHEHLTSLFEAVLVPIDALSPYLSVPDLDIEFPNDDSSNAEIPGKPPNEAFTIEEMVDVKT